MKIGAVHDGGGCGWYRIVVPMTELGTHEGFNVQMSSTAQDKVRELDFSSFDVIVGQRFDSYAGMAGWRRYRTGTNRLVYDNDDDVFSVTPENREAFASFTRLDTRSAITGYLTYSDLVTTTSEHLASVFEERGAVATAALPNCIPNWVLGLGRSQYAGKVRIGYMGGASHGLDIEEATQAVRTVVQQHDNTHLHLIGMDYRSNFRLPASRVSLTDWVNVCDDPYSFYKNLDFDIGIAPLKDTQFARSKSYIKALEYNARGIPVIASNVGPYKDYIKHGINGFLVKEPHEWKKYLNLLISMPSLREEMSRKSKDVAAQYTIERNWHLWAEAYEGLFK